MIAIVPFYVKGVSKNELTNLDDRRKKKFCTTDGLMSDSQPQCMMVSNSQLDNILALASHLVKWQK